jgi:5-methylthioadenosine/S-adenosylhomocysteine deaminase
MAPVQEYLAAGVAVGIGTDGEKENNNLDMFEELKTASLLARLRAMDAAALDSWQVLRMATIGGARALRLEGELGSLEPGKKADFIAVRMDTPRMTPVFGARPHANLHHNLVHAVRGSDVDLVVVDGATVAEAGRHDTEIRRDRACPSASGRLDAIMLAVQPVEEHLCRAQRAESSRVSSL